MEWLSKALNYAISLGAIKAYHTAPGAILISHLQFADDLLIFVNGGKTSIKRLLELIQSFYRLSGQCLNPSKSQIIFSSSISTVCKDEVIAMSGFAQGRLPLIYLGVPLYRGCTNIRYFECLLGRIAGRMRGWAKQYLSLGGRATLVNAVLNTVGIHTMMALPVPKTTLHKMCALMSNFLWDTGGVKHRHWVAWRDVCRPKGQGGLGIRRPEDIMLAFQGKLAWRFLGQGSLWAKYAMSRFKVGSLGSPIWNAFSHLIAHFQDSSRWALGRGNTKASIFVNCWQVTLPPELENLSMKDIWLHEHHREMFLDITPLSQLPLFSTVKLSMEDDRLVWCPSKDGVFSTKMFWESFQCQYPKLSWASGVWQSWIPPKISAFMWRLFHKVVPTDENVAALGIPLVSRCSCCRTHCVESSKHLFFQSESADNLWRWLSRVFARERAYGLASLEQRWLMIPAKPSFVDCLRLGMVCCMLWELWKGRNFFVHEGRSSFWFRKGWAWADDLASLIKRPHVPSRVSDNILVLLGVRAPRPCWPLSQWCVWQACSDQVTVNAAFRHSDSGTLVGTIFRNPLGSLLLAEVFRCNFAAGVGEVVQGLLRVALIARDHAFSISEFQCSHFCMISTESAQHLPPVSLMFQFRQIRTIHPKAVWRRVAPAANGAALTLVEVCPIDTKVFSARDLPVQVQRALVVDNLHMPGQDPFWQPDSLRANPFI